MSRVLALLFVGVLMGALDLAIIGPALPVIQVEFDMQQRELAGLINAYTLLAFIPKTDAWSISTPTIRSA